MTTEKLDMECSVQVVKVNDQSYQLDECALERILLREDIKNLPVVLVSVAGDYRGGKSFLLDFFLRYLRAPLSFQKNGNWLGDDDKPLEGFSWRGGSELDTTGMLLWSEPIHISLPSGQKVVVLLMDTQGTFDSTSTVRDCSTIFALSTLLSSVQIYNLSKLIKEDDLQHLQLFTEYGRLAHNEGGKPFQALQFLVRDWSFPYNHPYGAAGGQQLLDKKLEIHDGQHEELKEIRQHIFTCFDSIRCFLMPHPGLTVASNPMFVGHISDISTEFKESLLELVPSIFGAENLTPKLINGQSMKAGDLYYYFKSYINIFNSDTLPTPLTIMKATTEAGMMTAIMEARVQYEADMERELGEGQLSVAPGDLQELHENALAAARAAFTAKRKMGSQQEAEAHLERLMQELQGRLQQYLSLNEAKIQKAISEAKECYDKSMLGEHRQCLQPTELQEAHRNSVTTAMNLFDSTRKQQSDDEERETLLKDLNARSPHYEMMNNENISNAITDGKAEYKEVICNGHSANSLCLHPQHLKEYHERAFSAAIKCFDSRWRTTPDGENVNKAQFILLIQEGLKRLQAINVSNNKKAVEAAISYYDAKMKLISGYNLPCLHRDDLNQQHTDMLNKTLSEFYRSRTYGEQEYGLDKYKGSITQQISLLYIKFRDTNEQMNGRLVEKAHKVYQDFMETHCQTTPFTVNWNAQNFSITQAHVLATSTARQVFYDGRREGPHFQHDEHLDDLDKKIDESYNWFNLKFYGSQAVEVATAVAAGVVGLLFLKRDEESSLSSKILNNMYRKRLQDI